MSSLRLYVETSTFNIRRSEADEDTDEKNDCTSTIIKLVIRCTFIYFFLVSYSVLPLLGWLFVEVHLYRKDRVVSVYSILRLSLTPRHNTMTITLSDAIIRVRVLAIRKSLPRSVVLRLRAAKTGRFASIILCKDKELRLSENNFQDSADWRAFLLQTHFLQ